MSKPLKEIKIGEKCGERTYIGGEIFKYGTSRYIQCKCSCGTIKYVPRSKFVRGILEHCIKGVHSKNYHGMCNSKIYFLFRGIQNRCNNPKSDSYKRYGAKGIKCLWNTFEEFYKDMGESYVAHVEEFGENNTSIDRIDSNKNYCKENCKRATYKEQANNTKLAKKITYNGCEYSSIAVFCESLGLNKDRTYERLRRGWSVEKAANTGKLNYLNYKNKHHGETNLFKQHRLLKMQKYSSLGAESCSI